MVHVFFRKTAVILTEPALTLTVAVQLLAATACGTATGNGITMGSAGVAAAALVVVMMSAERSLNTPAAPAVMMVVSATDAAMLVVCTPTRSRTWPGDITSRPALSAMRATALPAVALTGLAVAALAPICKALAGGAAAMAPSNEAPALPTMPIF